MSHCWRCSCPVRLENRFFYRHNELGDTRHKLQWGNFLEDIRTAPRSMCENAEFLEVFG